MYFGRGILIFQRNLLLSSSGHCKYTFTKMCGVTWQETKLFIVKGKVHPIIDNEGPEVE